MISFFFFFFAYSAACRPLFIFIFIFLVARLGIGIRAAPFSRRGQKVSLDPPRYEGVRFLPPQGRLARLPLLPLMGLDGILSMGSLAPGLTHRAPHVRNRLL